MGNIVFYIDGFNFYYGLKSQNWRKYYWIDIVKFCEGFIRKHQELVAVKYFSAPALNRQKNINQSKFFSINKQNPKFKLFLGKYAKKYVTCHHCHRTFQVPEEKQTDVNIATQLLTDVIKNTCDISIIISADSDLIPPINSIREINRNHKIFVYFPPKRYSSDLHSIADSKVFLKNYENNFKNALFENKVEISIGVILEKPINWK